MIAQSRTLPKSAYSMPEKKETLINLQWVVVITISYFLFFREGEVVEDPRVYFLVLLFLISVLVLYRLPLAAFDRTSFAYSLVSVDTVLILLGILLYRDRPWDLFLIFFFGLFIAGIGEHLLQIVIGVLLVSIISVVLTALPSTGASALDPDLLLRIPFIFGVTLIYGYLADQVKRETRRLAETQHNLEHLSALYTVSSTVNSSLDLDVVLQEVIEKITGIFDFDTVRIYLFNPEVDGFNVRASFPPNRDDLPRVKLFRQGQGIVGKVGESGEPLVIEDTQTDPRYQEVSHSKNTLRTGHRFLAAFPIKTKFKCVGTIICNGKAPRSLLSGEIRLLASMGEQIGIAVENAQLYGETKKQALQLEYEIIERKQAEEERASLFAETERNLEYISALHSVTATASQSLELDTILQEVIKKITEIFRFDATRIFLFNSQMDELNLRASFESKPEDWSQVSTFKRGQGNVGRVAETGDPLIFEDIQRDPQYQKSSQTKNAHRVGISFFAVFPIKVTARTVGTIVFIGQDPRRLTSDEFRLITSIANQLGVAVENVRLYEQTKNQALQLEKDVIERTRTEAQLKQANAELARHEKALRDALSNLKATQSQLIQAEKLESVGKLAAGVAHEVKNPLAIMLQGMHYLSKHIATNGDNVTMFLHEMNNAVRKADSVVRGLLDFSAPSELSLNTEELNSVVEQSLSLVRHELTKFHVKAVKEFSKDLPPVMLDKSKIEQVFVNLFLNAVHAMPEGGTLAIKTYAKQLTKVSRNMGSREADHFSIGETVVMAEVEDTGTGIPKDKLSEVFDPFFTTKATGKGTGLGLTVTKKIIDLHGGTINIGNRKEGGVRASIMFKTQGGNDHEQETDPAH